MNFLSNKKFKIKRLFNTENIETIILIIEITNSKTLK